MTAWDWLATSVAMVLFWAVLITVAALLYRTLTRGPGHPHTPASATPERLLAERFARGEIDDDEYRSCLAVLRADGPTVTQQ
ncbi:SHOCT domain-containing protein [Streptomyces sp. HUAS ZL42]|uniref:SHOCT domain-containing protein n=1 Tax=Streptomyces sp. HUAS ZL42 TaxID=3231715 RepID=UPI00345E7F4D